MTSHLAPWRARMSDPYVRLALLSAVATAAAYGIGSLSSHISAVVAAITALISVRPTFHASLQEGFRQVLGVVVGAAFALVALTVIGHSIVALLLAILASFVAARLLRLGEEGAVAVGVTVILVVGPSFNTEAIETRLLGVLLGSVIGLAVSYFTRPGTPHGRALEDVVVEGERTSELLTVIGRTLATREGDVPWLLAERWLSEAEGILGRIADIRDNAEDALAGSRWSPMIDRAEAQAVLAQVRITEATALTVTSMCRDLLVAADRHHPLPAHIASSLSDVFLATAEAITEQTDTARRSPAEALDDSTGPVGVASRSRRDAMSAVRRIDETQPLLLGGSLLRDTEKITEILSGH